MRALLALIALAALLVACGFKGPLYLPQDKPAAKKPTPDSTTQERENKKPSSQ